MSQLRYKRFAIDFDGTIAQDDYPRIGPVIEHADRVIRKIVEHGGQVIIWTCRTKEQAEEAKGYLAQNRIPYHLFNEAFPEEIERYGGDYSRKIYSDVYIDDRCILFKEKGVDWLEVERLIFE